MATHIWSLLCRRCVIDKDDQTLSIFEVFERLYIHTKISDTDLEKGPVAIGGSGPQVMQLVSYWVRSEPDKPETAAARLRILDFEGKKLSEDEFSINLTEKARMRFILKFPAILFRGPGTYVYEVQHQRGAKGKRRWLTVARVPFEILLTKEGSNN